MRFGWHSGCHPRAEAKLPPRPLLDSRRGREDSHSGACLPPIVGATSIQLFFRKSSSAALKAAGSRIGPS